MLNPNIWSLKTRPKGNTLRASSVTTLLAVSMVYNEQVSHGKPSEEDTLTSWGVGYVWEVLRLLSERIPTGQEMVLPLEVWNWLLLVECMLRGKMREEWSGREVVWMVSDSLKALKPCGVL